MNLDRTQILETCKSLWQTALGLNLGDASEMKPAEAEPALMSYVNVSGEWQGAILLQCPESIARHAAAMLYSLDTDDVTEEELQDANNELTRMVGKQLQKLMPDQTKVSSGRSVNGERIPPVLAAMRELDGVQMQCEGRPCRIAVFENAASAATA